MMRVKVKLPPRHIQAARRCLGVRRCAVRLIQIPSAPNTVEATPIMVKIQATTGLTKSGEGMAKVGAAVKSPMQTRAVIRIIMAV